MKITISGNPGAGKGTLAKNLERIYKIPYLSAGNLRREYAKKMGISIQELNRRGEKDPSTDRNADKFQVKWASSKKNFILDGRLSYHFFPNSVKIFLIVDPSEGAKRIMRANREEEKTPRNLRKQKKINKKRCQSDIKRYSKIYGIKNCYSLENFDIVIDTTNRTPKEVLKIVEKKIIDFNQKMNPPKFYLAHATESRKETRKWEKEFEKRTGVQLINPFFEGKAEIEKEFGDVGKEKYNQLKQKVTNLFAANLREITRKDILGGIVILDDNWTWGTPAEQAIMWFTSKLVYTLNLSKEKNYANHPFVKVFSRGKVFTSKKELEEYIIKNKKTLFRDLEKIRRENPKNPMYKIIREQIWKNEKFSAFNRRKKWRE
ncbi:MAG: nucleoside monophosphate kinase [Nanoarchaeota archaeon]|nr:nucleoside monophosphate kinase [Nanoarchaeota archaeon]